MAENHRHSAANSPSVNSYSVGARSNAGSASGGTPRTVNGKGTILVCSDTSSRSPPIIGPHRQRPQSPNPTLARAVVLSPVPMPRRGTRERRPFGQLLIDQRSIQHSGQIHSENTIRGQCQVNRAHGRRAAFLPTVSDRQQWQKGDSLLNFKFGECSARGSFDRRWLTNGAGSVRSARDAQRALRASTYRLGVLTGAVIVVAVPGLGTRYAR